jgi:hypothetical protein
MLQEAKTLQSTSGDGQEEEGEQILPKVRMVELLTFHTKASEICQQFGEKNVIIKCSAKHLILGELWGKKLNHGLIQASKN